MTIKQPEPYKITHQFVREVMSDSLNPPDAQEARQRLALLGGRLDRLMSTEEGREQLEDDIQFLGAAWRLRETVPQIIEAIRKSPQHGQRASKYGGALSLRIYVGPKDADSQGLSNELQYVALGIKHRLGDKDETRPVDERTGCYLNLSDDEKEFLRTFLRYFWGTHLRDYLFADEYLLVRGELIHVIRPLPVEDPQAPRECLAREDSPEGEWTQWL